MILSFLEISDFKYLDLGDHESLIDFEELDFLPEN